MSEFKVWAPRAQNVKLKLEGREPLEMSGPGERGWWQLVIDDAGPNTDYSFLLNDDTTSYPDPRSLWQAKGVHGPSRTYDQSAFSWTDHYWHTPPLSSAILYELHIGTFS